jgi:hypothetical protein
MTNSILDPKFKYTPSAATDIRKTFARVRKEMAEQKKAEKPITPQVFRLRTARKGGA